MPSKPTAPKAPKSPKVEKAAAVAPENCSKCNHPETFHRSGACKVMSCKCSGWNGRKGAVKKRVAKKK